MIFINKPAGGPDAVGGLWPAPLTPVPCMNRSGTTHIRGDVVQIAFSQGAATEIATNDSNSYRPGYSNDTVWNTVIDPTAGGIAGGIYAAVCHGNSTGGSVADNTVGLYQFFGLVEKAFVIGATGSTRKPGDALTIDTSGRFDGIILSNECVFATYLDVQATNATATLRRVFLHNGLAPSPSGQAIS